jgi:4-hydroxy-tetrahydrodipicolinate reductase
MGRLVVAEVLGTDDLALGSAVTHAGSPALGMDTGILAGRAPNGVLVGPIEASSFDDCDVVIDFSTPAGLNQGLPFLGTLPLVCGTTGLAAPTIDRLNERSASAPVLVAANFSTGVTLLLDLVGRAAKALPDYDIEIVESHHRHKRDAPSGTALALGRAAASARGWALDDVAVHGRGASTGPRAQATIGFHAIRAGGIVGEHEVILVGGGERISLGHSAIERATFAQGAVRAARWIVSQPPGRYTLSDVLGLTAT